MATAYSPEQSPSVDQLNQKPQQKNPDITQEEWYKKLPENQKADVLKIREQVEELEKRLNVLDASKKYNGTGVKSLEVGLTNLQKRANADIT